MLTGYSLMAGWSVRRPAINKTRWVISPFTSFAILPDAKKTIKFLTSPVCAPFHHGKSLASAHPSENRKGDAAGESTAKDSVAEDTREFRARPGKLARCTLAPPPGVVIDTMSRIELADAPG